MKKKAKKVARKAPSSKKASAQTKKSGIRPLRDQVLIKPLEIEAAEEKTSFGLIIPVTVSEKEQSDAPERGVVVAVGPGKHVDGSLVPVSVSQGDTVLFSASYSSKKLKVGGVEHYLVSSEDILAVIG